MAIEGTASVIIDAPIEAVYAAAADVENAPRWQPEIKQSKVLQRNADGEQVLVETHTDAKVRTLRSELRFAYDAPAGLSWKQEAGDLKSIVGAWSFEDLGDGSTRATYTMVVDFGRVLGAVLRGPVVGVLRHQLIETMPPKLKRHVEAS